MGGFYVRFNMEDKRFQEDPILHEPSEHATLDSMAKNPREREGHSDPSELDQQPRSEGSMNLVENRNPEKLHVLTAFELHEAERRQRQTIRLIFLWATLIFVIGKFFLA